MDNFMSCGRIQEYISYKIKVHGVKLCLLYFAGNYPVAQSGSKQLIIVYI